MQKPFNLGHATKCVLGDFFLLIMEGRKTIDSQQFPTANANLIPISITNHFPKAVNQKMKYIYSVRALEVEDSITGY